MLKDFIVGGLIISSVNYFINKYNYKIGALCYSLPISFITILVMDYIKYGKRDNLINFNRNILNYFIASLTFYVFTNILLTYTTIPLLYILFISVLSWSIIAFLIYNYVS